MKTLFRTAAGLMLFFGEGPIAAIHAASEVHFESGFLPVSEVAGTVDIPVFRSGDTNTAFQVDYVAVANGTAIPGLNFLLTNGTIHFATGDREVHFHVPVLNDGLPNDEGQTIFGVYLTNATVGVKTGISAMDVAIQDTQSLNTLDLSYRFPFETSSFRFYTHSYSFTSAKSGQLAGWNGNDFVLVDADDSIAARFPLRLDGEAYKVMVQADDKILIFDSGELGSQNGTNFIQRPPFTTVNGTKVAQPGLARLDPDGSLDPSFVPASLPTDVLLPLRDGRILILNGNAFRALRPNGEIDLSFHPDPRITSPSALVEDANGKLILATLSPVEEIPGIAIFRLNRDGSFDPSFTPISVGNDVTNLLLQPDGKIIVAGYFGLLRLNPDGSEDENFERDWSFVANGARVLALDGDKILFTPNEWAFSTFIRRLRSDGSFDKDFPVRCVGGDYHPWIDGLTVQEGNLRINGAFETVNGFPVQPGIARLLLDEVHAPSAVIVPDNTAYSGPHNLGLSCHGYEGMGQAMITVRRLGDVRSSYSVRYKTQDGSAKAGQDFTAASGTLTFAPFEMEKTFQFPILDDAEFESDKTLRLVLTAIDQTSVGPSIPFVIHDNEIKIQSLTMNADHGFDLTINSIPWSHYILEGSIDFGKWQALADSNSGSGFEAGFSISGSFVEVFPFFSARYRYFLRVRKV